MSDSRDRPDPLDGATPARTTDPDAPPTDDERAEAERLREALDDPRRPSESAELARALSSAWAPRDLPVEAHDAILQQALVRYDARRRRLRSNVVRVSFGASALLALAAAVFLLVRGDRQAPDTLHVAAVAVSRSTQGLFTGPFAPTGGESARIDRIAMARGNDLRDNEFARWGLR